MIFIVVVAAMSMALRCDEGVYMAIISIVSSITMITLFIVSFLYTCKMDRALDNAIMMSKKHFSMFYIVNRWLEAKQQGKCMDIYLKKNGFHTVAIYGMHYIGERLYRELEDTQVEVLYGIDKNKDGCNCPITIYKPNDELPIVDAIIVTTPLYYYPIKRILNEKLGVPIIFILDVVECME